MEVRYNYRGSIAYQWNYSSVSVLEHNSTEQCRHEPLLFGIFLYCQLLSSDVLVRVVALTPGSLKSWVSSFRTPAYFLLSFERIYIKTYAYSDLPAGFLSIVLELKTIKQIITGKWDTLVCSFRFTTFKKLKKKKPCKKLHFSVATHLSLSNLLFY